ncbi:SDR family NAD(P)-dependent oxidoreductase [Cryptosporangium sp. NPDC051539]|uniref:type I polyketide synthase n=1 Tax=Cryptosporangium sp. NPDC051539 TaxID=3363962 RepID=UPI00378DBD6B
MSSTMRGPSDSVAVVGLAARFPGASDAEQFWRNLRAGAEAIGFPSDPELLAAGVPAALLAESDYVKAFAEAPDLERFDAEFFGFTPRDATLLDPQIRLFLEVGHSAIEDAGYDPHRIADGTGVFGAVGNNRYVDLHVRDPQRYETTSAEGATLSTLSHPDYASTRLSYRFGFNGPSLTVSTACSSSAVAVHLACQALRTGECDVAVAAGSEVEMPAHSGYWWEPDGPLSPDGHCRPFDHRAAGTIFGTGAGAVVLKRLDDALADGDHVRAVIRASATTNDGSAKAGFTAPGVAGQVRVIREAMLLADVDATDVSFVEAHATGTPLGDPIEVAALTQAYRSLGADRRTDPVVLGSVKGNIGHLGHASGIASLIKLVLCLENEELVPTANFAGPNPRMAIADTPFVIGDRTRAWARSAARPRIAGLSSFGFGGTNAHLVVEEAPVRPRPEPAERPRVVVSSARTVEAARSQRAQLSARFDRLAPADYADAVATLQDGRTPHALRSAVVAATAGEAATELAALSARPEPDRSGAPRPVVFLFPGQAAQYPAMGAGLHGLDSAFTSALDSCFEQFARCGCELGERWRTAGPDELADTALVQPLLFSVEYALAAMWRAWGIEPAAVLGHSVGELTAATVAGVFDLPDAARLISVRARAMAAAPPGGMLAVNLGVDRAAELLGSRLRIAVVNSARQTILSGPTDALHRLAASLRDKGIGSQLLSIRHAFHSPDMQEAADRFEEAFADVRPRKPTVPMISTVLGTPVDTEACLPTYWSTQLLERVRFDRAADHLLGDGRWTLLEAGPGQTLTRLLRTRAEVRNGSSHTVPTLPAEAGGDDYRCALRAAATVWTEGHDLDWAALRNQEPFQRMSLPGYPYQRDQHWLPLRRNEPDEPQAAAAPAAAPAGQPSSAPPFSTLTWLESPRPPASADGGGGLAVALVPADHEAALPALIALRLAGYRVAVVRPGTGFAQVGEEFRIAVERPGELEGVFGALRERGRTPALLVHALGLDAFAAPDRATCDDQLDTGFYSLMGLAQQGSRHAPAADLLVLARRSADLTGAEPIDPVKATAHGLVLSLAKEQPDLYCRLIDVADQVDEDALAAEIRVPGADPIVALRGPSRWVRAERPYEPAGPAPQLRRHGVYVLTGGTGGLGLAVAKAMAGTGMRPHLVLLGRHATDAAAAPEVAALRSLGATVTVENCDLGDRRTTRRVFDTLRARHGGINGVVHLAGVAGDGMLLLRDPAAAAAVLWPKVAGTLVLGEVLSEQPGLDFLATFSSRAAVDGLVGSADYAGANAFADAYTRLLVRSGIPALSVNWPAWHTVGMAAVPDPDPVGTRRWTTVLSVADCPILDEHRIDSVPVLPGTGHLDLAVRAFRALIGPADAALRLSEVVFQAPLAVPAACPVEVALRPDGDGWRFAVASGTEAGGDRVEHATGHVTGQPRAAEAEPGALPALRRRFTEPAPDYPPELFTVGPRWAIVGRVGAAPDRPGEQLVELALPVPFQGDLAVHPLHPSVLDCATSAVRIPDADGPSVPFGYESLELYADLPATVFSHLRRRPSSAELVVADADLYAGDGRLVARIEGFAMRRVTQAGFRAATGLDGSGRPAATPGIAPDEGGRLFLTLLGRPRPHQVLVRPHLGNAPIPLPALPGAPQVRTVDPPATRAPAAIQPVASAPASTTEPTGTASVSARLAAIWRRVLGVDSLDARSDFFELGGNSLGAVELMSAIRAEFGVRLSVVSLFDHPTLGSFAARLAVEGEN